MTEEIQLRNGQVVTPNRTLDGGTVGIAGDQIVRVERGSGTPARTVIDADGCVVMPGLVDVHGDDIERHLFPRPEANVGVDLALRSADRTNLLNGITTKFHAIAFEDAPGENRSIDAATGVARAIDRTDGLVVDNRVHTRCELAAESIKAVIDLLNDRTVDLVSVMHHEPGRGQFDDDVAFRKRYHAGESTSEAIDQFVRERQSVDDRTLQERARRVVDEALSAGVTVASHDDERPETVEGMARLGVTVSEFPIARDAARRAKELDVTTVMGAPNLVRGGSLWGNLDVADAIAERIVDVLCSDYHPPSLLAAPFVDTGEPLAKRISRVTSAPADAVGLSDRGRIRPGARADVIVVDPSPVPTVECVIVEGTVRYHARMRTDVVGTDEPNSIGAFAS